MKQPRHKRHLQKVLSIDRANHRVPLRRSTLSTGPGGTMQYDGNEVRELRIDYEFIDKAINWILIAIKNMKDHGLYNLRNSDIVIMCPWKLESPFDLYFNCPDGSHLKGLFSEVNIRYFGLSDRIMIYELRGSAPSQFLPLIEIPIHS